MRRASEDGATLDKSYSTSLGSVFLDNLDDDFLEGEGGRLEVEETGTKQPAAHPHHELEEQSCADRFRDSASCPSVSELDLKVTRADDDSDDHVQAKLSAWATELVDRLELRSCKFEQVAFEATAVMEQFVRLHREQCDSHMSALQRVLHLDGSLYLPTGINKTTSGGTSFWLPDPADASDEVEDLGANEHDDEPSLVVSRSSESKDLDHVGSTVTFSRPTDESTYPLSRVFSGVRCSGGSSPVSSKYSLRSNTGSGSLIESQRKAEDVGALQAAQGWISDISLGDMAGQMISFSDEEASPHFSAKMAINMFSFCLTLFNAFFVAVKAHLNLESAKEGQPEDEWLEVVDRCFTILFCIEVVVRVAVLRREFFAREGIYWNFFDVVLCLSSLLVWILDFGDVAATGTGVDLRVLRPLRNFRALRVIRVFRSIRKVRELRLMLASIIASLTSLTWAFIFLLFILYLFSIFIAVDVANHVRAADDGGVDTNLLDQYGSLAESMLTLFMAISGGKEWSFAMEPLQDVGFHFYTIFFVFYVFFMVFGVMNVLTAVFCESASRISEIDRDLVIQEQMERTNSSAKQLKKVFNDANVSGDSTLNEQALELHLQNNEVIAYLKFLEIDVQEARGLFQLLDVDESGCVNIDEFVFGMMRLKGAAKGVDVATLMYETKKIYVRLVALAKFMEDSFQLLTTDTSSSPTPGRQSFHDYLATEEKASKARLTEQRKSSMKPEKVHLAHFERFRLSVGRRWAAGNSGVLKRASTVIRSGG